ncbi:MAG: glycosyltransferase family 4 protein [Bacteroidales bacterium]|nr:glycosyltransferase family 4 protein [Bacteroidales bacterium]
MSVPHFDQKGIGGGWIESLEKELTKDQNIKLGISYNVYGVEDGSFKTNNTTYYPVIKARPKNKIMRIVEGWNHKSQLRSDMKPYLDVIDDFKPDVIHIFGTESEFGLLSSFTGIPCLIYIQGILTIVTRKWFSGLSPFEVFKHSHKLSILKGRGLYHDYYKTLKAARREEIIYKSNKIFIGRTDWDRRISSVLSPGSQYFHCDEIMRSVFYQNEWISKSRRETFTIISTTRKAIYKGLETILESALYVKRFFPKYKFKWRVAGVRNTDEVSLLIERKLKVRFGDVGISLLGPLSEEELVTEMLQADLFVHPSHTDNSPNSICEAMLLGMPIIATYAGGIPSIILDKEEGLLIQDGDSIALTGAVLELYHNPESSILLGENARKKALMRNHPAKVIKVLLGIYNVVLNK